LADRRVQVGGERGHLGQCLDVAAGDTAGIGGQDAAGERAVVVVLDHPPGAVCCQPRLDSVRALGRAVEYRAMRVKIPAADQPVLPRLRWTSPGDRRTS
jgi:hypothetical protein